MQLFPKLHKHQLDTAIEDNHIHLLTKQICSYYSRIRFYQMGKEFTAAAVGPRVPIFLPKPFCLNINKDFCENLTKKGPIVAPHLPNIIQFNWLRFCMSLLLL